MGYYTRYELTATPDNDEIWDAVKTNKNINYAVGDQGNSGEECKWYDNEKDMVEFSKKFPDITFCLHGEGEETGDIWNKYFRNGKKQICKAEIIIPPMLESNWINGGGGIY